MESFSDRWFENGGQRDCTYMPRAVASLTVPGGQEFHLPHLLSFLIFPQTFTHFLPHLDPPGGRVTHPGRPWLRHCIGRPSHIFRECPPGLEHDIHL